MEINKVIRKSIEDYRENFGKCLMIGLYSSFCMIIYELILFFLLLFGVPFPVIGAMVLNVITTIGINYSCLIIARKEKKPLNKTLFIGFENPLRLAAISIKMTIFTLLWGLLLILPGIMKALSYSQAYFIYLDNPGLNSKECLDYSSNLMENKRMNLFDLCLLLCIIPYSLMILALYVMLGLSAISAVDIWGNFMNTIHFIILNIFISPLYGLVFTNFYSFIADGSEGAGKTKSIWNIIVVVSLIMMTLLLLILFMISQGY